MSRKRKNKSDYEITNLNPGWIKTLVPEKFDNSKLNEIIWFYVIHTICTDLSANGIEITRYGWSKNVWRTEKLKKYLYNICNFKKNVNFYKASCQQDMKNACEVCNLKKDFSRNIDEERVAFVKVKNYNEILSLFYHIRNSLAHGRIAIKENKKKQIIYILEDGKKSNGRFIVTARMILKEDTLLTWIKIIKNNANKL